MYFCVLALKLLLCVHDVFTARERAPLTSPVVLGSTAEKIYAKFWEVVKEASKEPGLEYLDTLIPTCLPVIIWPMHRIVGRILDRCAYHTRNKIQKTSVYMTSRATVAHSDK